MIIEDDVSKKVEKVESPMRRKERNRVDEYLILVQADMTNMGEFLQLSNAPKVNQEEEFCPVVIAGYEEYFNLPDEGPGLPR